MKSLILSLLALPLFAHATMFPRGKEPKLDARVLAMSSFTKTEFDGVLALMNAKLGPVLQARGKSLKVVNKWSDDTINAFAHWEGNTCVVEMFGGLARAPGMSVDGFTLVGGHEVGHCVGDPPTYPGDTMSDEGQSDTYSVEAARLMGFTEERIEAGAKDLGDVLASLNKEGKTSWPGPVLPAVKQTYHSHPAAQCRRDTIVFKMVGVERPNCWYAGGHPTGVDPRGEPTPIPTPIPTPTPTPIPTPTPAPCPKCPDCNCCQPQPGPGPIPRPRPRPPFPMPFPGGMPPCVFDGTCFVERIVPFTGEK